MPKRATSHPRLTVLAVAVSTFLVMGGREVFAGDDDQKPGAFRETEADEIIDVLALAPLLEQWDALSERPGGRAAPQDAAARLDLQREIDRRVVETAFQVDQVVDAIDDERADLQEVVSWGGTERDRRLTHVDLAIGLLAGGAAFGSALTIFDQTARAGAIAGTVAAVVGTGVSLLATRAPGQSRPPYPVKSRMLGPYFGLVPATDLYPRPVWRFLKRAPAGDAQTRRDRLLGQWRRLGRAPSGNSKADRERLANLVDTISPDRSVNFEALSDRASMLSDVRAQAVSLKRGLSRFLVTVRVRLGARTDASR